MDIYKHLIFLSKSELKYHLKLEYIYDMLSNIKLDFYICVAGYYYQKPSPILYLIKEY